jgi:hypothetical protein
VLLVANYRVTLPTTSYTSIAPGSSLIVHLAASQRPTSGQDVYVGLGSLENTPRANPDQIVLLNAAGRVANTYATEVSEDREPARSIGLLCEPACHRRQYAAETGRSTLCTRHDPARISSAIAEDTA